MVRYTTRPASGFVHQPGRRVILRSLTNRLAYEQVSAIMRTDWTFRVVEAPIALEPDEALLALPAVPAVDGSLVEPVIPVPDLSTLPETSTLWPT